ncbi:MAG TPA: metallophosphoesterase [Myxococcales bacterium]|nr:metallophosphoesterase [Myxococcales bacterium]
MARAILEHSWIALLPALVLAACSSQPLDSTPCQTAVDCPAGQGCSAEGLCEPLLSRGNGGNGSPSTAGQTAGRTTSTSEGSTGGSASAGTGASAGSASAGSASAGSASAGSASAGSASAGSAGNGNTGNGASSSSSTGGGIHFTGGDTGAGSSTGGGTSTGGSTGGTVSSSSGSSSTSGATAGSVGPQGGTLSSLVFAIVGDTRPQNEGDTANYPTQDITWIFQNIMAASPRPAFVVGTGDYAYCSGSDCAAQTAKYITAADQYYPAGGQIFLTMGNHECNGYTASNCAPDEPADGASSSEPNYTNFFNVLNTFGINSTSQSTLSSGSPYYEVDVSSSDSTDPWTAKFVFIAANAWDSGQASWLTSVMAKPTTYTFVIRHESYEDDGNASSNQPGDQGASDQIIDSASEGYTMLLVGHTHEYSRSTSGSGKVELIVGNGGAQTSGSPGYVICSRVTGGNISCQPYNAGSTPSVNGSAVVVNAAGAVQ